MRALFCLRCGRQRREGEYQCPAFQAGGEGRCGGATYGPAVPGSAVLSVQVQGAMAGVLAGLLVLPPGDVGILKGPRGIGKTSVALTCLDEPWLCTSEMSPERALRYAARLGVRLAGVSVIETDRETGTVDLGIPPHMCEPHHGRPARDVACDSLTGTGLPRAALAAVRGHARATGARVLAVSQTTTDGSARGGSDIEFDGDAVVNLTPSGDGGRLATVEKSRAGPEGSRLYTVTQDQGVTLPTFDGYYSVSGVAPAYRLAPFPGIRNGRDPFAAFLRGVQRGKVDRGNLPAPPAAVAALDGGKLYAGRWREPPDWRERRAFALAHGVPYFSPSTGKIHTSQGADDGDSDRP